MTGELLTVKEYAARQGMTEQAVYKQIKAGKLQITERQENGRTKKYIIFPTDEAAEPCTASEAPDQTGPDADPRGAAAADPRQDPTAAALEKAVAALTAQLEEKDRQIARLTELLSQSHQIQAHTQKLLEQGTPQPEQAPVIEPEPETEPAPAPEAPKKRTFLEWLFGL